MGRLLQIVIRNSLIQLCKRRRRRFNGPTATSGTRGGEDGGTGTGASAPGAPPGTPRVLNAPLTPEPVTSLIRPISPLLLVRTGPSLVAASPAGAGAAFSALPTREYVDAGVVVPQRVGGGSALASTVGGDSSAGDSSAGPAAAANADGPLPEQPLRSTTRSFPDDIPEAAPDTNLPVPLEDVVPIVTRLSPRKRTAHPRRQTDGTIGPAATPRAAVGAASGIVGLGAAGVGAVASSVAGTSSVGAGAAAAAPSASPSPAPQALPSPSPAASPYYGRGPSGVGGRAVRTHTGPFVPWHPSTFKGTLTRTLALRGSGLGLSVTPDGRQLLASYLDANLVTLYNIEDGSEVWTLGANGGRPANVGLDVFKMVAGACLAPKGHGFLVCDAQQNRLNHFDGTGTHIRVIGEGILDCPMTVHANDEHIVVVSAKAHSIAVFNSLTGAHIGTVGHRGTGTSGGDLAAPHGVVLLEDGEHLLVASRDTDTVVKFTLTGDYVTSYGPIKQPYAIVEAGAAPGDFIVSSFSTHEVYSVAAGGPGPYEFKKLCGLGVESDEAGGFNHITALATASVNGVDTLFVVDQVNPRCQMFV